MNIIFLKLVTRIETHEQWPHNESDPGYGRTDTKGFLSLSFENKHLSK